MTTQRQQPINLPIRLHIALHSLAFILGLSLVFIAMGFGAGWLGDAIAGFATVNLFGNTIGVDAIIRVSAGLLLLFFGLLMLKAIPIDALQQDTRVHFANKPQGYLGSVVVGLAFAAGWTPCIGPILGSILGIAANTNPAQGALLLLLYTLGFAIPFFIAAQTLTLWRAFNKYVGIIEKIGGILLLIVGLVLIFDITALLIQRFPQTSLENTLHFEGTTPSLWVAFAGGALSFLSPCVLPILPSFLAYLTGLNAQQLLK